MSYYNSKNIGLVDEKNIKGFFNENRWLSNFYTCNVYYDGVMYSSSEAAYQAAKCEDEDDKKLFEKIDASKSKKLGKTISLRKDWNNVKEQIMYDIIYAKFTQNKELKDKLIKTGDKYLEETNWWNDVYWGCNNAGKGENKLGLILMDIRNKLK